MSDAPKKRPSARRARTAPRAPAPAERPPPPVEAPRTNGQSQREPRPSARRPSARAGKKSKQPAEAAIEKEPASDVRPAPKARRPSARRAAPRTRPVPEPETTPSPPDVEPSAAERDPVYELEETVDRLIDEAGSIAGDPQARRRAAVALSQLAARLGGFENEPPPDLDASLIGGARELLSTDYYVRQWGRLAMRNRSEQVDAFGLDRTYESRVAPLFDAVYNSWFRVTVRGVSRVPAEGRAIIVANHGGALPWDGLMMRTALRLEHPSHREARWLAEDFVYHMPFLGAFLTRVGAVRACPENAERLLEDGEVLTVFPEGIKGVGKLYRQRYQLQRFGRGGYVKLALRTRAPIVPAGIVGSDEAYPLLFKSNRLAKLAGLPFLPVTPTFPWLGPLGLVPLPSRWAIVFGEPIDFSAEHGPEAANDALLVSRLSDEVRARVQELVSEALGSRESAYLG